MGNNGFVIAAESVNTGVARSTRSPLGAHPRPSWVPQSVCQFVCQFVCPFVCQFVCQFVCPFVGQLVWAVALGPTDTVAASAPAITIDNAVRERTSISSLLGTVVEQRSGWRVRRRYETPRVETV
jgi:hypothetical protein